MELSSPEAIKNIYATNNTNSDNVSNTSSTRQKSLVLSTATKASNAWDCFERSWKEMAKYSKAFSQMEQAMDEHSQLQLETKTAQKRVADVELALQVSMGEHGRYQVKMNEENAHLQKLLENVRLEKSSQAHSELEKEKAIHKQDMLEMDTKLEAERKKSAALSKALEKSTGEALLVEDRLNRCIAQLKTWESYESSLKDTDFDQFTLKMTQLLNNCRGISRKYFLCDLPEKYFVNQNAWESLNRALEFPLGFPPSNSPAAKHVRMAAAMQVIAGQLCNTFFKPCFVPYFEAARRGIEELLSQQYLSDARKERLTRALMLSSYPPKEIRECIKHDVQTASHEIFDDLSPLGGDNQKFRSEVAGLFHSAAELWTEAQSSKKMVEASLADDSYDWPWASLEDFTISTNTAKETQTLAEDGISVLFPRVYVPEDNITVSPGYVLYPSQDIVIAAKKEFTSWLVERTFKGGQDANGHRGPRRLSMRKDRANGPKVEGQRSFLGKQSSGVTTQAKGALAQNGNRVG